MPRLLARGLLAALLLMLAATAAVAAKRDLYEQAPGFRGIEYGSQPQLNDLELIDDARAPVLVYARKVAMPRLGVAEVEPAHYYFHKDLGFYKATLEFRHSHNDNAFEELTRLFGDPTQRLPLGGSTLIIWLRPDYTAELTAAGSGMSRLKVVSTTIAAQVGE